MKKILTFALILTASFAANAQSEAIGDTANTPNETTTSVAPDSIPEKSTIATFAPGELAQQADSAYTQDNFALAEKLYLESIRQDGTSSTLFYNLGNTYYRQGNLGKAIVNYERALKLDPTNTDARDNLEFVKSKITDRQTVDDSSITIAFWNNIVGLFQANTWAWIAVALFAICLGAMLIYVFSSVVTVKKICFFGAIIVFMLCALSIVISFSAANRVNTHNHAIILPPSAQLSTTPREARTASEEAFLLHEGTKVEIVDSVATPGEGTWYEVAVGAGDRAWIKASDVEKI